jgi:hypothetical protein
MLHYHFTSRIHLGEIMRGGLSRGGVHVARDRLLNAVWLTTDPGDQGHGLEWGGAFMSELERREAQEWSGTELPHGARFPKNADVRISVDVEEGDANLHEWLPWARRRIEPDWLAFLHPVALGNLNKAKSWRLYFGVIPPQSFVAVEELAPSPTVVPLRTGTAAPNQRALLIGA